MNATPSQQTGRILRLALETLLGITLAMGLARAVLQGWVALPPCGWRWLTGLPCPFCGGIRCLVALSHGEILGALAMNPMVFLGLAGGLVWALNARLRHWLQIHAPARRVRWLALIALINWIYLIAVLR